MGIENLEVTPARVGVAAAAFGVVAGLLLVICNPDEPLLAVAVAAVASIPLLVLAARPTMAVVASGGVTIAAPLLVACPNVVVYPFVVVLMVFAWVSPQRGWFALGGGFVAFAVSEILGEAADQAEVEGTGVLSALGDPWSVASGGLEAAVLALLVVGLGTVVSVTQRQAASMVALEQANQELALQEERHRIARDLHDVAAHHLSSIVVRTRTATKVGDGQALEGAVTFAGDAANDALAAMRQIVSVLRTPQSDGAQPSLADIDDLVATTGQAGVVVEVAIDPMVVARVNRPCELAVVRIVQEALSNVIQHSEAATAEVLVNLDEGGATPGVRLVVSDPGPHLDSRAPEPGFGIIGMRERAESLGGTLTCGRSQPPGSGWVVEAWLPVEQRQGATDG